MILIITLGRRNEWDSLGKGASGRPPRGHERLVEGLTAWGFPWEGGWATSRGLGAQGGGTRLPPEEGLDSGGGGGTWERDRGMSLSW